jgi:class 3 adenylate cyclase
MAKFLGDGILLLWNTRGMSEALICSVVTTLYEIGRAYRTQFYPEVSKVTDKPPVTLRCGLARGRVFSVGNGRDYIGHCINTAARLQKLSLLTFCFPHRGFHVQGNMREDYRRLFIQKSVPIRGVGESELVWVLESEFNQLPDKQRAMIQNP